MDVQEEREGKELVLVPIPIPIRFGEVSQGLRVSGSQGLQGLQGLRGPDLLARYENKHRSHALLKVK
jgi:hypothetical protein